MTQQNRRGRYRFPLILMALALAGCGGSGGGSSAPIAQAPPVDDPGEGLVIVGLTDAPDDFVSYDVEVLSVKLERANGVSVETLPEATMVDFAQYVEATEFVTAASVPNGLYTGMSLVLDYSNARVLVEDDDGDSVEVLIVDESGDPVGQTELVVDFSERDRFRIAPGIPAHVTLDFDLAASHKVDLDAQPAQAALGGVLIADTLLEDPKPRRARGLLASVDPDAGEFDIALRPFFRPRGDFGLLTVSADGETTYEIDTVSYVGSDGLAALADKPRGTSVVVLGRLEPASRSFVAEHVLAGDSVPFGEADIAGGTVVARQGDELTLRGVTLVRRDMSVIFNDTVSVVLGGNTVVTQQGASLIALGVDDISVGQRLTAVGTLSDDATLDASEGLVRLRYTDLAARTLQVSPLVVDLAAINRRPVAQFDFDGTGGDASGDADPQRYEVDAGSLTLDGIDVGQPTRIRGLVAPFGTAPNDFVARTIADVSAVPARLRLNWLAPGDPDAVLAVDETGIVVGLNESLLGRWHYLVQAGVPLDLLDAGVPLTVLPSQSGRGVFAIRQDFRQQVFFNFAAFSAELAERLDGSTAVIAMSGLGAAAVNNEFTPARLLITLE